MSYLHTISQQLTQRFKIFISSIAFVLVFIFLFGGVFLFVNSYEWQGQKREILNESIESVASWQDAEELFGDYRLVGRDGKTLINRGVFEFLPEHIERYEEHIELEGMHFFVISKVLSNGTILYFVDDITDAVELREITTKSLLLSGLALLMFVGMSAWYFTEKIFQPIRLLVRSMENFSLNSPSEEDSIAINGSPNDEFVILARNLESLYQRMRIEGSRREELSNNIAHELKNGLFEIGSTLELAEYGFISEREGVPPRKGKKSGLDRLHDARTEVHRLNELTSGLLLLGNKDKEVVRESIQMEDLIKKNIPINHDGSEFEILCDSSIHWNISPALFSIALKNIIGNAVKFNSTEKNIIIRCEEDTLSVQDFGCGIHPDDLPFVFDVFYTGSKSRTKGSGHGIGLALTKRICELHGFTISIESSIGLGTTVIINTKTKGV